MKKVDRLRWIEGNFGPEFVLQYFFCRTWEEIKNAINFFESRAQPWGMRTDTSSGNSQGYDLPFLFDSYFSKAKEIWDKHGNNLCYIVSKKQPPYILCQAVAKKVDEEHIVVEFLVDSKTSLRHMYRFPEKLRRIGVGPCNWLVWPNVSIDQNIRCFRPREVEIYGFNKVYDLMLNRGMKVEEIEFTVVNSHKIIIW